MLNGEELHNVSFNQNYTKDGSIIDCQWHNFVLLDDSGNVISILSLAQDISDRKQAELELKQSEQKFRAIFDQTFQFIGLLEPNGRLIEANRTCLDFIGLTSADVKGKLFWETPWWSKSLSLEFGKR